MDSIDYYERQGSQYFEETIDLDMTEHLQNFLERLPKMRRFWTWAVARDGTVAIWRKQAAM